MSKEIEQGKEDYKLLQSTNNETLEQKNRVEIDLAKEKDKVKELAAKLDESENNRKRTERQKEGVEKERDSFKADKDRLNGELIKIEGEKQTVSKKLEVSAAQVIELERNN